MIFPIMKKVLIFLSAILVLAITITYFQNPSLIYTFIANIGATTGRSIYVSVATGLDTNSGDYNTPYKTIVKAYAVAQPGDVIFVEPGIYKEKIKLSGKHGTSTSPIRLVGTSTDPAAYPVLDGGNVGYTSNTDSPVVSLTNSSNLTFERLRFKNSGLSSISVDASHYITVRRNIFDYLKYGVILRNKSSHLLMEYNEFFQSYPSTSTWTQLKDSKWEGGAYTSFGGAGMSVIRYNYFHDQFNSIYFSRSDRVGNYYDANIWVYRNRFEHVVDDPYEPESYAFNNHFFQNSLKDTHRLISLAPESGNGQLSGPVYVYANQMVLVTDPTREAASGRENSAYKLELSPNYFTQGVYLFNNSIDASTTGTNGSGIDFLSSTVNYLEHFNHAYKTLKNTFSTSSLTLKNSKFQSDMSPKLGYTENPGYNGQDPQFTSLAQEKLTLSSTSPARGKAQAFTAPLGFTNLSVIAAGSDLGAFRSDSSDFINTPSPVYVVPPGGEDASFPQNYDWPQDVFGGSNPISAAPWLPMGVVTVTSSGTATPQPTTTPTPVPTPTSTSVPTPTPTPTTTPTPTPTPTPVSTTNPTPTPTPITGTSSVKKVAIADAEVREANPNRNYEKGTTITVDHNLARLIYLKFDLALSNPQAIKNATLNLYVSSSGATSQTYQVSLTDHAGWREDLIKYSNRSSLIGSPLTSFVGTQSGRWLSIPLPLHLIDWSSSRVSLVVHSNSEDAMSFKSSETSYKPYINVWY